jgi:hypothetical protein
MRTATLGLAILLSAVAFGAAEAQQVAQSDRELVVPRQPTTQQPPAVRGQQGARGTGTARAPGEGPYRETTGSGSRETATQRARKKSRTTTGATR